MFFCGVKVQMPGGKQVSTDTNAFLCPPVPSCEFYGADLGFYF